MSQINFSPLSIDFSLQNAYALALCSKLAYEDNEIISQKLREQGLDAQCLEKRGSQAFIAHKEDCIIVAFRGSSEIQDWMTNIDIEKKYIESFRGCVHQGFWYALELIFKEICDAISEVQKKSQPIWLTGHSLGGAMALLMGARFERELDKPFRGLYTFGQPRAMDRDSYATLKSLIESRYYRVVNHRDVVTRVPPREMKYSHAGSLIYFDSNGSIQRDPSYWQQFLESISFEEINERISDLGDSFVSDHLIDSYISLIEACLANTSLPHPI